MPGRTNQGLNYKIRNESSGGFWTSKQPDPCIVQPNMDTQQKQMRAALTKEGLIILNFESQKTFIMPW